MSDESGSDQLLDMQRAEAARRARNGRRPRNVWADVLVALAAVVLVLVVLQKIAADDRDGHRTEITDLTRTVIEQDGP